MSFEYLEHTADVTIKAEGSDLKEAFEQAALGFYGVLTDLDKISQKKKKELTVQAEDKESLLYDWIDELIFLFDTELFISNKITMTAFSLNSADTCKLEAELIGEKFNPTKHPRKT
ncbi:MAG: archease, partial [Asgard group archaeon]|nr:archease [Asgard group archaeon]